MDVMDTIQTILAICGGISVIGGAAAVLSGAEMVEQILQRSKAMRHVLISMQRCPHKESKAESRIFLHSFVMDSLV